jgi:hypothetical protein
MTMRGDGFHSGASGLDEKCATRKNPLAPCRRGRLWHSIASQQGYVLALAFCIRRVGDMTMSCLQISRRLQMLELFRARALLPVLQEPACKRIPERLV